MQEYGVATNLAARPVIRPVREKARACFDANRFSSSRVIAVMTDNTRTGSSNGGSHGNGYCSSITAVFVAFVGQICDSASQGADRPANPGTETFRKKTDARGPVGGS